MPFRHQSEDVVSMSKIQIGSSEEGSRLEIYIGESSVREHVSMNPNEKNRMKTYIQH